MNDEEAKSAMHDNSESQRSLDQVLADRVAETALQHYNSVLPTKGKPKENEWTVYAAIVACRNSRTTKNEDCLWVVSCATGTKCSAVSAQSPHCLCQLRDSHGEVLARRGLVRVLWKEIQFLKRQQWNQEPKKTSSDTIKLDRMLLEDVIQKDCTIRYQLRRDIQLHLFISDSPCGDASIYPLKIPTSSSSNEDNAIAENIVQFTGAKAIVSDKTNIVVRHLDGQLLAASEGNVLVAREGKQQMGILRTKSGRSNLELHRRSTSMSCSDKLVRWSILGLEGGVLSALISDPIRFTLIVVGQDHRSLQNTNLLESEQQRALQRAIVERGFAARKIIRNWLPKSHPYWDKISTFESQITLPSVFVSRHIFPRGKSVSEAATISLCSARKRKFCNGSKDACNVDNQNTPRKLSPAGISINWQQTESDVELVVGARGIRQGKTPKCDADYEKLQSRLCRNVIMSISIGVFDEKSGTDCSEKTGPCPSGIQMYRDWKVKQCCSILQRVRRIIFDHGPLAGWVISDEICEDEPIPREQPS